MRAADLLLEPVKKYRESINPPYKRKDLISIVGTVFILLAIPLTVFVAVKVRPWGPRAAGTAAAPTTIGSVIEPGSMVSGASYIVFAEGTNYYAKDGKTGEIKFSASDDAAPVINAAISALPSGGGKVVLAEGTFMIRSSILRPTGTRLWLEGQGIRSTTIMLASGVNDYCFKKSTAGVVYETKISDLLFHVDKANNPDGGGIDVTGLHALSLANVEVFESGSKDGIYGDGYKENINGQTWYNVRVSKSSHDGIHLINGAGYLISHSQSNFNTRGWYIQSAYESFFDAIDADQNGEWSFVIENSNRSSFKIKNFESGAGGVNVIGNYTYSNIIELQSYRNPKALSSGAGLRIADGPHDNHFLVDIGEHYPGMTKSVILESTAGVNNTITGRVEGLVINNSQGNIFQHLQGYVTENSGTATITSSSNYVDVNHGIAVPPSADDIQVTATNNLGNASEFWISDVGASSFRINVNVAPGVSTATFVWKAEVK